MCLLSFIKIEHSDDYTYFTVTTASKEPDLYDSFATIALYMFGGMYGAFAGNIPDNIQVDFVNEAIGNIITSANSKDME